MCEEELFDIPGYEGIYSITRSGKVWSYPKNHGYGYHKPRFISPCINMGYYRIPLRKEKKGKYFYLHRLIAQIFIRNAEDKPCINHKDGNKLNNKIENLEWCTYKENDKHSRDNGFMSRESFLNGRVLAGKRMRILSDDNARTIKYSKETSYFLSKAYNIQDSIIRQIREGRTYREV